MIISNYASSAYIVFTFYIPLILCCLSLLGGFFVIRTHSKFIRMKLYSGKLILHVTIIQLIITIIFGTSLFYKTADQAGSTGNNSSFRLSFIISPVWATILGALEAFVSLCYFFYHFFMSHNLYYTTNQYNSHSFKKRHQSYIIITQTLSFLLTFLAVVTKQINLQDIGVFGIGMKSRMQFIYLLVLAILVPFSLYAICYSRSYNKKLDNEAGLFEDDYEREVRHDFVNTNILYLVTFIITWAPYAAVSYYGYHFSSNCASIGDNSNFWANIAKVVSLNLVCMSAFCGAIIKVTRPIIKRELSSIFARRGSGGILRMLISKEHPASDGEISLLSIADKSTEIGELPEITRTSSVDEALIFQKTATAWDPFAKKKMPLKKPITPADHLDIVLSIIQSIRRNNFSENLENYPTLPWPHCQYKNCRSEDIDPNEVFSEEERNSLLDQIKKAITLHKINYMQHAEEVFNHLFVIWDLTKKDLEKTFDFNENVKFFANIHKRPFSHLEKRYFHVTPNKKVLLQIIEKESKLYFLDSFLPAYHEYMAANRSSFIVKILGCYTFNLGKNTHNVMAILNNYEKFYKDQDREGMNTGIPSCIVQRYLIDGKNFRQEKYLRGALTRRIKAPVSEKHNKKLLSVDSKIKNEIMQQLKKDLTFLSNYDVINYRVVLLVTRDEKRKNSLISCRPKTVECKEKYLVDGSTTLSDGSALKIFIDTNLVTGEMKSKQQNKRSKINPVFSIQDSLIYRQCIEEMVNSIL